MPSPSAPGPAALSGAAGRDAGGLGLVLPTFPQSGPPPDAAALSQLCRRAEAAGAAGLWACDHLFWHGPSTECLTALAVAAAATTQAIVGSCVLQLPLRRPTPVAKAAASLQELSGGRFVLGVGVGTHPGEYEAAGIDFARRGALLDRGLAELRALWSPPGGTTPAGGGSAPAGPDGDRRYLQLPQPAAVPVWVGGSSDAALARAARHDGWMPLFLEPEDYAAGLVRVRRDAGLAGRDPAGVTAAVVAFVALGRDAGEAGTRWMSSLYGLPERAFARHLLAGGAASVAGELLRWVDRGAQHVVVFVTDDHPLPQFEDLAGELLRRAPLGAPAPGDRRAAGVR